MGPPRWTTPNQTAFLFSHLPAYIKAVENKKQATLTRYWTTLEEEWFLKWSAEEEVGLPTPVADSKPEPLTAEQLEALGNATQKTKNARLPTDTTTTSTSTCKSSRSLFKALKDSKSTRPVRAVEMYQKLYNGKIKVEVDKRGYGEMNEEACAAVMASSSATILTAEELEAADSQAESRRAQDRSARMSLWRTTLLEMYAEELDEVKHEVEAATSKANEGRTRAQPAEDEKTDKTPEQYQHGIDQIGAVFAKVHQMTMDEMGWFGITIVGGPMPRRGGQISTKTICFGRTAHGNDFAASVPDFDGVFKAPVQKWLKRAFPHHVRDARAMGNADTARAAPDALDDLITMDHDAENETETAPIPLAAKSTVLRRPAPKKHVAAPTPSAIAVAPPQAPSTPSVVLLSPTPPSAHPRHSDDYVSDNDISADISNFDSPLAPNLQLPDFDTNNDGAHAGSPLASFADFDAVMAGIDFSDAPFQKPHSTEDLWNMGTGRVDEGDAESMWTNPLRYVAAPIRPSPRPMHTGAAFAKDRDVGGSPGRSASFNVTTAVNGFNFPASDYRPSALFQAFAKTPSRTSSFTSSAPSTPSFASLTSSPLTAVETISTVANTTQSLTTNHSTPTPAASSMPLQAAALRNTRPSPISRFGGNVSNATSSTATPIPALVATPRPSALVVFSAIVANATPPTAPPAMTPSLTPVPPAVSPAAKPPAVSPAATPSLMPAPQYFQSRPMCNPPKGHPLAPTTKKANGETATRKPPAKHGRGRPRGGANDENDGAAAAAMDSGRAESTQIRREAAALCKQTSEQLAISKRLQAEEEAKEAEERREQARLHNPAGGVDLVIIPRPKHFAKPTKNPDGSDIIHERKRTWAEIAAAADEVMLENLKKSREGGPAGKRKAAVTADGPPAKNLVASTACFVTALNGVLTVLNHVFGEVSDDISLWHLGKRERVAEGGRVRRAHRGEGRDGAGRQTPRPIHGVKQVGPGKGWPEEAGMRGEGGVCKGPCANGSRWRRAVAGRERVLVGGTGSIARREPRGAGAGGQGAHAERVLVGRERTQAGSGGRGAGAGGQGAHAAGSGCWRCWQAGSTRRRAVAGRERVLAGGAGSVARRKLGGQLEGQRKSVAQWPEWWVEEKEEAKRSRNNNSKQCSYLPKWFHNRVGTLDLRQAQDDNLGAAILGQAGQHSHAPATGGEQRASRRA
ncbi:hypothetical protein B0H13DRAFT_1880218 [Mycena leptocephala]|nr:hypothetical protein B0H13DRAFT_1880218 [Mycena leptocephala]